MTAMSTATRESDVNDVAREAGLTQEQTHNFRNVAASMAMEGMALTLEELRVGAARRRIGLPHGQPTRHKHCPDPDGVVTFRIRQIRPGGCPLYPRDGGALPPGKAPPDGTCRLTTTGPYLPLQHPIEREC